MQEQPDGIVMTVLEARVERTNWDALREAYDAAVSKLPRQITETFLVQSTSDLTLWRIITMWQSREILEEYRRSTETPGGVLIFRAAKAEPTLSIFEVAASRTNAP